MRTKSHMDASGRWGTVRRLLSLAEDDDESFNPETWAPAGRSLAERDTLWENYLLLVDLYKHYLDIAWKTTVWYYAITGAILTYYLSAVPAQLPGSLPLLLVFLAAFSLGLALLYVKGAGNLLTTRNVMEQIATRMQLPGRPHVEFAVDFVFLNAVFMLVVSAAALVLFAADVQQFDWP